MHDASFQRYQMYESLAPNGIRLFVGKGVLRAGVLVPRAQTLAGNVPLPSKKTHQSSSSCILKFASTRPQLTAATTLNPSTASQDIRCPYHGGPQKEGSLCRCGV
jgi:hypothetical protein